MLALAVSLKYLTIFSPTNWSLPGTISSFLVVKSARTINNSIEIHIVINVSMLKETECPNIQKHIAIILTLFLFILTANLVGQLPWKLIHLTTGELAAPTNDINMTAAMAIVVSIYYIFYGVKRNGFKFFFKGFSIDGIIITLVDTLELFVRPFSLALRLFANILAGELLVGTFISLLAVIGPLPFMLFELFVALIQALVFTLLSTTYISMAVQHEN